MFRASLPASLRITFQLILVTLEKGSLLTSKGFAVQECAKLLAYCPFSIKARLMDHQALKDIRMALLDGIAMMKLQIEQQNPSKTLGKHMIILSSISRDALLGWRTSQKRMSGNNIRATTYSIKAKETANIKHPCKMNCARSARRCRFRRRPRRRRPKPHGRRRS